MKIAEFSVILSVALAPVCGSGDKISLFDLLLVRGIAGMSDEMATFAVQDVDIHPASFAELEEGRFEGPAAIDGSALGTFTY